MRMYLVRGLTMGLSETILTTDKKRAKEISELRKLGPTTVKTIDKKPNLRVAVGAENEMLEFLEWNDQDMKKWHTCFTVDPMLYKHNILEVLRRKDK